MVAVLGDMRELGPEAARFHREVGALAADAGVALLVAVGEHAGDYAAGYGGGRCAGPPTPSEAAALVPGLIEPGDVVLVKASRGVGLERVTRPSTEQRDQDIVMGEILIAGLASLLDLDLPRAEVHPVPARARVRPAHPRGRPGRAPAEGRHADDGRASSSSPRSAFRT